jgi:hypothetical protein
MLIGERGILGVELILEGVINGEGASTFGVGGFLFSSAFILPI